MQSLIPPNPYSNQQLSFRRSDGVRSEAVRSFVQQERRSAVNSGSVKPGAREREGLSGGVEDFPLIVFRGFPSDWIRRSWICRQNSATSPPPLSATVHIMILRLRRADLYLQFRLLRIVFSELRFQLADMLNSTQIQKLKLSFPCRRPDTDRPPPPRRSWSPVSPSPHRLLRASISARGSAQFNTNSKTEAKVREMEIFV